MNKKFIKKLAHNSFTDNKLDEKKVKVISSNLNRGRLKTYLREIKNISQKNTVYITIPSNSTLTEDASKTFSRLFPGRKIEIRVDTTLIGGVRIENYDMIYDLSIKSRLEDSIKSIEYEN